MLLKRDGRVLISGPKARFNLAWVGRPRFRPGRHRSANGAGHRFYFHAWIDPRRWRSRWLGAIQPGPSTQAMLTPAFGRQTLPCLCRKRGGVTRRAQFPKLGPPASAGNSGTVGTRKSAQNMKNDEISKIQSIPETGITGTIASWKSGPEMKNDEISKPQSIPCPGVGGTA